MLHIHWFTNEKQLLLKVTPVKYGKDYVYYVKISSKTCRCGKVIYFLEDNDGKLNLKEEDAKEMLGF